MKQLILIILLGVILFSCEENNEIDVTSNNVVLLKVDYLTNKFEAGKVLNFPESENFTISSIYKAPGDFGSIALYYSELNEKLFEGTIIWMGTGEMSYPSKMDVPKKFSKTSNNLTMPSIDVFEYVKFNEFSYIPDTIDYESIWQSIDNLKIVKSYRNSNSSEKIHLFLYTPSVGVGNPEDWDWFVILRN